MIHVVKKLLDDSTSSALAKLRQANKVALVKAPQQVRRPYAVIDLEGTTLERYVQGSAGGGVARTTHNIMVYITATGIEEAWSLKEGVQAELDEYNGTVTVDGVDYAVARIALRDVTTDAHELHEFYIIQMMFDLYVV